MDSKPADGSATEDPENDSGLGPGVDKLAEEIEPGREDRNVDGAKLVTFELMPEDVDAKAEGPILADPSFPVSSKPVRARRWSKLESISIENFKAIANTTVTLGDVTILVGPNGSGKSSVLQAIHWAVRAASYIAPKNSKEMMAFDRIDYLPSSEPLRTAHRGELKSDTKTAATKIVFNHAAASNEEAAQSATVKIFAARNRGGITAHIEGGSAVTPYKQRDAFLTAYIPGLAGLSERETILAQPLLRRQAASGDAGGVLRNVLFNLASRQAGETTPEAGAQRLERLNRLIQEVHSNFAVAVEFDAREDYNITAKYVDLGRSDEWRSLETAATGLLQVIQIFAYIVLFRPRIVLIDEPDAHLHPDKQERLIEALERAAAEFETQIVLTTHSPHVVRAASPNAKLVWMTNGAVRTDDDDAIRNVLGWGGLDKDVYFFVEDEDDKPIREVLRQWPDLSRRVAVCPCFGIDNVPKGPLLEGLLIRAGLELRAVIHRDRDFMTDEEVVKWRRLYLMPGAFPWVCAHGDVESYFCQTDYLAALYGVDEQTAEGWRSQAAANIAASKAKEKFFEKRRAVNWKIYRDEGGSPASETLWLEGGGASPRNQLGKTLYKALKSVLRASGHDDKLLNNFRIPSGFEMAPDLRWTLERAIGAPLEAVLEEIS
jgi:predicted ATPase